MTAGQAAERACDAALRHLTDGDGEAAARQLAAVPRSARGAVWHSRQALADLLRDRFDAALAGYARAAALDPANPDHHTNHAAALVRLHRLEDALAIYDWVLANHGDHPIADAARTALLLELGRGADAVADLSARLSADPEALDLRLALFAAHVRLGEDREAVDLITEALEPFADLALLADADDGSDEQARFERQVLLRWTLHTHFSARQQWLRAIAVLNQLRTIYGDDPPLELRLAWIETVGELGDHERAFADLQALETKHGADPDWALPLATLRIALLSQTYDEAGVLAFIDAAEGELGAALAISPARAQALTALGRIDEAAGLLEELAVSNPHAFAQLVHTRTLRDHPAAEAALRRIADHPMTPSSTRESAGFALATLLDAQGDFAGAMQYLALANETAARSIGYRAEAFTAEVDAIIAACSAEWFAARPILPASDPIPVFVLGMPRSGTTLTESILGSHPDVFAAGELGDISRIVRTMPRVFPRSQPPFAWPALSRSLIRDDYVACARHYLRCLNELTTEHRCVVDKMPHNFLHAGLIHTLFPRGKIIHVRRDPRDVALSNYQQNFAARHGGLGYAFDLEDIARQLNDYHRLMEHWRSIGVPMFELFYEDLVGDQAGVTRRLIDFLGLDWDAAVLDFASLDRPVRTASVAQVRKPLYQTSRQKWRRYESWLGPLLNALDPRVTAPWE